MHNEKRCSVWMRQQHSQLTAVARTSSICQTNLLIHSSLSNCNRHRRGLITSRKFTKSFCNKTLSIPLAALLSQKDHIMEWNNKQCFILNSRPWWGRKLWIRFGLNGLKCSINMQLPILHVQVVQLFQRRILLCIATVHVTIFWSICT